jgi:glyoxylase-like metal-dependent hydrolase (beta-lactamase superfamily II)/rhodanese-related sulfurtransferase
VIFHQFLNGDLGCACYLVGDEEAGIGVLVDPPLAIEPLLEEAERRGLRIVRTIETHTHADHVSGHGRLALEHGIPVSIHPAAAVDYPNDPMVDGDAIEVGAVTLGVIHTPGHRPEHCGLAVVDRSRADEPWLVLTGDSLFVGDIARPDLAVAATEGAEGLYHSLHRLLELSDGVEVFPGHVAGSLCGKSMCSKPSTTIGFERRFNSTLQIATVDAFIAESAAISAPKPPNLTRIVAANHGPFEAAPPVPEEVAAPPDGVQLLDARPASAHLAGHRPGSINVPVSGSSFATKAGFLLDASRPVCVLAETVAEAHAATRGLQSVAFFDIPGYVLGGGEEHTEPVDIDELEGLIADGATVVDVREPDERDDGFIPGSVNIPYRLVGGAEADLPTGIPVVTICESGARAAVAASVLRARGYDARPVVDGGLQEWRRRGGSMATARG